MESEDPAFGGPSFAGTGGSQMTAMVPLSWGELIDKITILEIKNEQLKDAAKLANVRKELGMLSAIVDKAFPNNAQLATLTAQLKDINQKLWVIEDDIRQCERAKSFDKTFIELARAVYFTNDERSVVKRHINDLLGSELVEEKSYEAY